MLASWCGLPVLTAAMTSGVCAKLRGVLIRKPGSRVLFAGIDEERESAEQKDGEAFHRKRGGG